MAGAVLARVARSFAMVGFAAEAARIGGSVAANRSDARLVADMSALGGPGFNAADLAPAARDFYEHTSSYRFEVWTAGARSSGSVASW
jgi:hypothetical protein